MSILFVHGVSLQSPDNFEGIVQHLRQTVAPVLVRTSHRSPDSVHISTCYWGDIGVRFAWNLASLPSNSQGSVASMGSVATGLSEKVLPLASGLSMGIAEILTRQPVMKSTTLDQSVTALGPWQAPSTFFRTDPDALGGLLVTTLVAQDPSVLSRDGRLERLPLDVAVTSIALDRAAHEIAPTVTATEPPEITLERIASRAKEIAGEGPPGGALGPGQVDYLVDRATTGVRSLIGYASDVTGEGLSNAFLGVRPLWSAYLARFLGDAFVYLQSRDGGDGSHGPIVARVLESLKAARAAAPDEPLIVLTHSMGGQLIYDCLTWYMEHTPGFEDFVVDVWLAVGSQVGLFEEMKLFKTSRPEVCAPQRVTPNFGSRLKTWVNYWDPSDVLSFVTTPVFEGSQDSVFVSGTIALQAHGQYLVQPRLYRMLADDVATGLALGEQKPWQTPAFV